MPVINQKLLIHCQFISDFLHVTFIPSEGTFSVHLGIEKRNISFSVKFIELHALFRYHHISGRYRDYNLMLSVTADSDHTFYHLFKLCMYISVLDPSAEYKEFISSYTAEYVITSEKSLQFLRILEDHLISICMSEHIVGQFKIIQIKHNDRSGFFPVTQFCQMLFDPRYCCLAVKSSCEGINLCDFCKPQFLILLIRDIKIIPYGFHRASVLIPD